MCSSATNLNDTYLLNCFYPFAFFSFMHKLWIFQWECRMIRRKISKGETTCHNKPHFCFVKGNIAKMVMQSGICPFEAKNNICSLAKFFFFLQKIRYLKLWYWGMHFMKIIFVVVSVICWLTSDMVQAVQNPCQMPLTLNVDNDILVNICHIISWPVQDNSRPRWNVSNLYV